MSINGSYLISTFENKPDLYNTKPPLMIWLQTLSIKLFGLNEFAIRFPSALAGFLTILLSGLMLVRTSGNLLYGALGIILLTTSGGFIQLHGSLTGDYDSLLSLFLVLAFIKFRSFLLEDDTKAIIWFTLFHALAIMSKSAAAIIVFPIYFILIAAFRKPAHYEQLIIALMISLLPFTSFCIIRELASPGYLEAIWNNDFHGRYSRPLEGHKSEWHYYIVNLFDFRFHYWIWILPIALFMGPFRKNKMLSYYSLTFVLYLILISSAGTRIHWYDMPLLPLVSIILTLGIKEISQSLKQNLHRNIFAVLIAASLVVPSIAKFEFISKRKGLLLDQGHYELSKMMKQHEGPAKVSYIANWYDAEFYFYTKMNPLVERSKFRSLEKGDTVMLGNMYKDSLPLLYDFNIIQQSENARKVVILNRK